MNEIPLTMRASVLKAVGEICIEERQVPRLEVDEVLIRVASVGVCGSDVHYFKHGRIGDYVLKRPLILGHEASGTIVAVGENVDPSRVGQRVAIEPQRCCRVCEYCRSGHYNLCPRMEFYATPPIDGAFCEYVKIQDNFAYSLPESISDHAGALMEPLSVGIAAIQKAKVQVGHTVLIAGGGPIGIITAQVARAFGAVRVVVSDPSSARRKLALSYGATEVVDPTVQSTSELGAHSFIDASGAPAAISGGLRSVRPGGIVVLVGSADIVPMSVPDIAMREVSVTGIFRYTNTWPIARDLLETGQVELDSLVTHVYGLDQVRDALTSEGDTDSLKKIIVPGVPAVACPRL